MGKFNVVVSERSDRRQSEQPLSCTIVDSQGAMAVSCTIVDSAPDMPVAATSCTISNEPVATSCTISAPVANSCTITSAPVAVSAGDRELAPLVA